MAKYPFTPSVLDSLPEELAELYRQLEIQLLEQICDRIRVAGKMNEVEEICSRLNLSGKRYNEEEATAKRMLPRMEDMTEPGMRLNKMSRE